MSSLRAELAAESLEALPGHAVLRAALEELDARSA